MSSGKKKQEMCLKMIYNVTTFKNYSNTKWQSSTMQNHNYFGTNLIYKYLEVVITPATYYQNGLAKKVERQGT